MMLSMDQNSVLFLLSAIVQALAAVMAILGTFVIFVYSLKWGRPPTKRTRRIWLGGTFSLAFLLLVTIGSALFLMLQISPSGNIPSLLRTYVVAVQVLAIIDFCALFGYTVLVHSIMHPKILSVDLRILNLECNMAFPKLEGTFLVENLGSDMARDVKIFVKLLRDSRNLSTKLWDLFFEAKGSPYIGPEGNVKGGMKMYKLENEIELFRGDLHAGDRDQCHFTLSIPQQDKLTLAFYMEDAYGFKSSEAKYTWVHSQSQ